MIKKNYEQKYILNIPISGDDDMVVDTQQSWMQLYIMNGLFDEHINAMSSLQSALSRRFHIEYYLRELARLYIEHRFITADEADTFMAEVPTINDSINEPQAQVTDQLLDNSDSDMGDVLPNRPAFDFSEYQNSFTSGGSRGSSFGSFEPPPPSPPASDFLWY